MHDGMIQVALVGQPNVGKSSLFTRLTGVGVISSNYPGTTVEFEESAITRNGITVHVHDLPGTYGLSGNSEDEDVTVRMLGDEENDSVIVVADATNLESSIVLCLEVIELGLPVILALNKIDASRKKFEIDVDELSRILGIDVIPVSSKTSEGVDALADAVCAGRARTSDTKVIYDEHIEDYISELVRILPKGRFDSRGVAVKLLEGTDEFSTPFSDEMEKYVLSLIDDFSEAHGETVDVAIGRSRYATSDSIVRRTVTRTQRKPTRAEMISDLTIDPFTGIAILLGVLFLIFTTIVFLGSAIAEGVSYVYAGLVGTALIDFGSWIGGTLGAAVMTGVDGSIQAILGLVIPYIMVFYIILGILEDSGYIPRVVVLMDRVMHKFGLHGGGFIPLIVGIGCNVPAIMATRTLASRRERIILTTLIVMAVPCSAQIAIIMGATGTYAGMLYSFGIFIMLGLLMIAVGLVMNRFLKYEPSNLAMEIPDLTMPQPRNVLFKVWYRIKDFFVLAFPLLLVGSIIIEIALTYDMLDPIVQPMAFVTTGMLGLPAVVIIAFIAGILRKEMAVGMLGILAGPIPLNEFMTPDQFVVFGVVMAVYMPCLATILIMGREIGWKETAAVSIVSIVVAVLIGTAVNSLLAVF